MSVLKILTLKKNCESVWFVKGTHWPGVIIFGPLSFLFWEQKRELFVEESMLWVDLIA